MDEIVSEMCVLISLMSHTAVPAARLTSAAVMMVLNNFFPPGFSFALSPYTQLFLSSGHRFLSFFLRKIKAVRNIS